MRLKKLLSIILSILLLAAVIPIGTVAVSATEVPETYYDYDEIYYLDLKKNGEPLAVGGTTVTGSTVFTYDRTSPTGSVIFRCRWTVGDIPKFQLSFEKISNSAMAYMFGAWLSEPGAEAGYDNGRMWLRPGYGPQAGFASALAAGGSYNVEFARLKVANGPNKGKYYVYIKIDDVLIAEDYVAADIVGENLTYYSKPGETECSITSNEIFLAFWGSKGNKISMAVEVRNAKEPTCTEAGYTGDTYRIDNNEILCYGEVIQALGHDYINIIDEKHIKTSADCTHATVYYKSCSRCGEESNETFEYGEQIGHNYVNAVGDEYLKSAVDCTRPAIYYKSCSRCGGKSSETFENGEPLGHDYVNAVDNKYLKTATDCTHAAVYYKSCTRCGNKSSKTFENGEPLGHDYVPAVTPPTCTAQGYTTYTCSRCKDSYTDNYVYMPCGDNCGFIIKGNTLYIHGSGETDNYKTQTFVPWYDYADSITEIIIDEGITRVGNYAFYCLDNLKSIKSKNSNLDFGKYVTNNSNGDISVLAENGGNIETYCEQNGVNYIDVTITPELETVTANSITVKAVNGYEYSKGGTVWKKSNEFTGLSPASEYNIYARYTDTADMFEALGEPLNITTLKSTVSAPAAPDYQSHTDNSITLAPNELYEFSIDGENWQKSSEFTGLSKNTIYRFYQRVAETETEYASGPSAALIIAIPDKPEILEAGYENILVKLVDGFQYCLDDFVWQDSNTFDKLIDDTEYYVYQRLKSVDGEKVYQITSDYTAVTTDNGIAHTHAFGEWSVKTEPTCTEKGAETGICTDCGKTVTRDVNALGHDYKAVITNPTCTEEGYTTHTCSRCGDSYVDSYTTALGHLHTEIRGAKEATCEEDGFTGDTYCTDCGAKIATGEVITARGHTESDWITDIEPSDQSAGEKHKECTVCGKILETEIIPKTSAPGDINGDGEVDNKDLTRLFQYLSNWEVEVSEAALDVNGDNSIDNKDLTRLFQYLSNWDVEIS